MVETVAPRRHGRRPGFAGSHRRRGGVFQNEFDGEKMTMSHTLTISISLGLAASLLAIQPAPARAEAAPAYAVAERIPIADGGFDYASFDPAHRRLYISRAPGVLAL